MSETPKPVVQWFRVPKKLRAKIGLPRKEWRQHVANLLAAMPPVDGEQRAVVVCVDCGRFIGRRYIPYGWGQGVTINPCLCQLTAHRPSTTLVECTP